MLACYTAFKHIFESVYHKVLVLVAMETTKEHELEQDND